MGEINKNKKPDLLWLEDNLRNLLLNAPAAICVFRGPEHVYELANEMYLQLVGNKQIIGRPIREAMPEMKGEGLFEIIDNVFASGEPFIGNEMPQRLTMGNGTQEEAYFNFVYQPTRNSEGEVDGILCHGVNVTEQFLARKKIEKTENQQAFLLKLSDTLRPLDNPLQIEEAATKLALDFLDADRCYYNTLEEGNAIIMRDAFRGDLASIAGVYPISGFHLFKSAIDAGRPFLIDDVNTWDIAEEGLKELSLQLQISAMMNIPVLKNGTTVGVLSVMQRKPRRWTDLEVQLAIEIAERTWAAVERGKAEEAMRKSEEKYRTLLTSIEQGFTLCELIRNNEGKVVDLYILEVNPNYEEQTGVKKEMVIGKPLLQVFPSLGKWLEIYTAVVDNQCPVVFEQYFDDTDRWFTIEAYPVKKDRFAVLFSDITERKQAEEKRLESEREIREIKERLKLSIRAGKIGVWSWDVKKDILTWSNEQKEIYGFSASDEITSAAQFNALIFPEDLSRIQVDQSAGRLDHEYDFRITRKNDGEIRWIKSRARNTLDSQGALQFISGVNIDITEQVIVLDKIKKSEEALAQQKQLLESVTENTDMALFLMDENQYCIYINQAAEKMTGFTLEELKGKQLHYYIHHSHPDGSHFPLEECLIDQALPSHNRMKGEEIFVHKNGSFYPVAFTASPIMFSGKAIGTVIEVRETSVEKRKEEVLKESERQFRELSISLENQVEKRTIQLEEKNIILQNLNKELEAFTYISSHDLQEPLRKIQIFAGRILHKEKLSDSAKEHFSRMQEAATSMQKLIKDLLIFSRMNTSERKFEISDINKIVDEVKEEFKESLKEKNAIIQSNDLCEMKIIPFQFRQLVHNLISNALKFSKTDVPSRIIIKNIIAKGQIFNVKNLLPENKYCHISFADNGIGFDKQFSERIFGVFQKLHGKEEYAGTGIGLAIVKKIVENHNGIISAESALGKGATFNIYLPV